MSRRGFTLLEVLIAIGLVLAVLALSIPPLTDALDRRAFESAGDTTFDQLLLARAHAQATGRAVEVVYHPRTRLVEARRFEPGVVDEELPAPYAADGSRAYIDEESDRAIAEAWATVILPEGLRLTDEAPVSEEELLAAAPDALRPPIPAAVFEAGDVPLRLAVFMPDGSALLGREFWLTDDAAAHATISVNPWTGLPSMVAGASGSPSDAAMEDETYDEPFDDEPAMPEDLPDEPIDTGEVEREEDGADPGANPTTNPDEDEPAR